MSRKWITTGKYELTRGLNHRFWSPTKPLSVRVVNWIFKKFTIPGGGGGEENNLLSENMESLLNEDGIPLAA